MRVFFVAIVVLIFCGPKAVAQDTKPSQELVMYDPLFWKDKLSLKNAQSRRIEEINKEFYESLRQLKRAPHSKEEMQSQLAFGLQERSVKIWATLGNRQKKKLEKIIETTSLQGP
jgi:hypothetical protein